MLRRPGDAKKKSNLYGEKKIIFQKSRREKEFRKLRSDRNFCFQDSHKFVVFSFIEETKQKNLKIKFANFLVNFIKNSNSGIFLPLKSAAIENPRFPTLISNLYVREKKKSQEIKVIGNPLNSRNTAMQVMNLLKKIRKKKRDKFKI